MGRLAIPLVLGAVVLCAAEARADVALDAVFGDHAVLQRDRPIVVRGTADAGEVVTVSLAGRSARATADGEGRFRATLEALPAGGPFELAAEGTTCAVSKDVLVGEVWLCSGQSNMVMTVGSARDADQEAAAGNLPEVRVFTVAMRLASEPEPDVTGRWIVSRPDTVKGFSAVAWFFGREIHREMSVPVGLVVSAVNGTVAEAWTPPEAVEADPELRPLWERWRATLERFDAAEAKAKWEKAWRKWKAEAESDRRAGRTPPPEPRPSADPRANPGYPGSLWRGMVAPLAGLPLRGFLWYQGESNAARAAQYRFLFPDLIRSWRSAWRDESLPFYFVQIANFGRVTPSGGPSPWAELREAQALALRDVPRTGMAVAIDVGEPANIHPRNKQEVGRRLALWALANDYGRPEVECRGPTLEDAREEGGKIVLTFTCCGSGLATSDGGEPGGFAVASAKGDFQPAEARIEGNRVTVGTSRVRHPVAVRYAWADSPEAANLVNSAGLPASPFRTDSRPLVTEGKN